MISDRICGLVAATAFLCSSGTGHAAPQRFADLVAGYYAEEFRAHPVVATRVGVHDYDTRLDDVGAAGRAADGARLHKALDAFTAIDPASLSPGDRDDREMLISSIKGSLLDLETIQYWRTDPGRYSGLATGAIFGLVHRDFAPPAERLASVVARERLIPALLATARENIAHPPRAFVDIAIRNVGGSIALLRNGVPEAFAEVSDPALQAQLKAANDAAIAAFEAYRKWLDEELKPKADGNFALGATVFAQRMADYEMVDTPPEKLLEIAYARLHRDQAALAEAAHRIDPTAPVDAVLKALRSRHPTAETLLQTARDELSGLRRFVVDHHIVTVPSDLLPIVEDTPGFQRATTSAATDSPGPLETHATQAFYYVTPPDPGLSPEKLDQYLQAYYFSGFELISAHEVWPGHFVQYLTRRAHPQWSLARKMAHAQSTTEGWAHYAEQMMVEEGLDGGDPKIAAGQLEEALMRDCRFIASLEMHIHGKSLEDAVEIFMKEGGSPEPEARREAYRGTSDPGYLNYTVGKLEILKLRDDYKAKMGAKFSLQEFHDRFLAAGLVPVKLIRRELMGEDGPLL
jgi:uncharacterized protein (DUF885 family)